MELRLWDVLLQVYTKGLEAWVFKSGKKKKKKNRCRFSGSPGNSTEHHQAAIFLSFNTLTFVNTACTWWIIPRRNYAFTGKDLISETRLPRAGIGREARSSSGKVNPATCSLFDPVVIPVLHACNTGKQKANTAAGLTEAAALIMQRSGSLTNDAFQRSLELKGGK